MRRVREVLRLRTAGVGLNEIARRVGVAPSTVRLTLTCDEGDGVQEGLEHEEWNACPCCGRRMIIIETFAPGCQPRLWPIPSIGLDSS